MVTIRLELQSHASDTASQLQLPDEHVLKYIVLDVWVMATVSLNTCKSLVARQSEPTTRSYNLKIRSLHARTREEILRDFFIIPAKARETTSVHILITLCGSS